VYIQEDKSLEPYFVLTDNYNGNCLLLRKDILDKESLFNNDSRYSAYYAKSIIDKFLNDEFLNELSANIRCKIVPSNITITTQNSLGICGTDTEIIERNIFILSLSEIVGYSSTTIPKDGKLIEYFSNKKSRISSKKDGTISNWWTRTPNTWDDNALCTITNTGAFCITNTAHMREGTFCGVRPAFCLPKKTKIIYTNNKFTICD